MATPTPEEVEKTNSAWWDKHGPEFEHHATTPLDITGRDFPLGPKSHDYGRFIYCPMPVSDHTRWGFSSKAGLDRFLADVKAGTLPVAQAMGTIGKVYQRPAAPALPQPRADPFDLIGGDPPAARESVPVEPVLEALAVQRAAEPEGEEETDEWGAVIPKTAAVEDPFKDLL